MKKFLTSVAMALLLVGCAKEYDDSGLKERVSALETRVTALESNVQALQSAIGEGVFVAKVQEYVDPDTGKTIGVTVTYTNGDVKYFEITPQEDYDGPVLGVIKSGSGELVWAIDGIAILIDGKEVPVYQTPVFTLDEDGFLWVEVNGEKVKLGQVQNEGATLVDGIFTNIKVEQDKIVLTLSDETTVNIPFAEAFKIELMLDSCVYTAMEPIPVHYAITAATAGTVVRVAGYNPFDFSVAVNNEDKIIEITPLANGAAAQLLIVADSGIGLVSTATLLVEPEGIKVVDAPATAEYDYIAEGEGGVVTAHVVTNIAFEVKPVDAWIHLVSVKAEAFAITLSLDDNDTGALRTGMVNLVKKGTETVIQTIIIAQDKVAEGPKNLSKKGPANSYIVTAAGDYMFWAVKGNSNQSVGEVAKAEILWETDYSDEAAPEANSVIAKLAFAGEYISFSTPETLKPGAAAIVAKNASDEVLWTWLIWIPETEIGLIENAAFYGAPIMDRNLGAADKATTAAAPRKTYGMYYQWGRNNPLPGFMKTAAEFTKVDGPKSTAYAIAHPTEFIKVSESDSAGNWNEEDLQYLWEDESHAKGLFDPCPPGYRVPAYNSETGLWTNGNDGWAYNWDANNYAYGDNVFPMAGWYSSSASVGYEAERSIILSSTAKSDSPARACLKIIRKDKGGYYYANYFRQEAASVRCIAFDEDGILPPTPGDSGDEPGGDEPGDEIVDLSKTASANCYIIPATSTAGAQYKFKAVKGNSDEAVAATKAEVFWETWGTADEPTANSVIASAEYDNGYVIITMPETLHTGNAVIAAKDANDVILWSWHIWVPADEVKTLDGAVMGGTILDRNLGALVAPEAWASADAVKVEAFGLYYQWGRKDPFPGPKDLSNGPSKTPLVGAQFTKEERKVGEAELVTVEWAIQHPNYYPFSSKWNEEKSRWDKGSCDWLKESQTDLWDKDGKKTIYDPCPVGYKVPAYDTSLAFWKMTDTDWTFAKDNFYCKAPGSDIAFPLSGYIDDGGGSIVLQGRVFYWSSKSYSDATRACGADIRGDKDTKYYGEKTYKARGACVRCVAE